MNDAQDYGTSAEGRGHTKSGKELKERKKGAGMNIQRGDFSGINGCI